jgi:hypothetical protein
MEELLKMDVKKVQELAEACTMVINSCSEHSEDDQLLEVNWNVVYEMKGKLEEVLVELALITGKAQEYPKWLI